jgi:hypothetical protein
MLFGCKLGILKVAQYQKLNNNCIDCAICFDPDNCAKQFDSILRQINYCQSFLPDPEFPQLSNKCARFEAVAASLKMFNSSKIKGNISGNDVDSNEYLIMMIFRKNTQLTRAEATLSRHRRISSNSPSNFQRDLDRFFLKSELDLL